MSYPWQQANRKSHVAAGFQDNGQARLPCPTPPLVVRLTEHLENVPADPDALLFTSPDGDPIRHTNFRARVWVKALEALKLPPVGIHVLRHSAAARMIGAGATPKAVQMALGHGSAALTLTVYGHLFDADLDTLALALDVSAAGRARDESLSAGSKVTPI